MVWSLCNYPFNQNSQQFQTTPSNQLSQFVDIMFAERVVVLAEQTGDDAPPGLPAWHSHVHPLAEAPEVRLLCFDGVFKLSGLVQSFVNLLHLKNWRPLPA